MNHEFNMIPPYVYGPFSHPHFQQPTRTRWTISSFISYLSSIVAIALISSYMSVAAMICYSYVWFIIEAAFIYSSALYNSLYKHVNNAVATETEEGYNKAGKYIRVCILINLIISVPISIGVVYGMGPIMKFYGFGDAMVQMCHGYTIIAVVHNFARTTSGFVTITTDIDGYADFNAKYAFFDSLVDIALSAFVIPLCRPSLVQLGLIHFANDIISTAFYYYLTHYRWGWYDVYRTGMGSALTYDVSVTLFMIHRSILLLQRITSEAHLRFIQSHSTSILLNM